MGKVYCGKCVYGKQDVDKNNKRLAGRIAIHVFAYPIANPVFVCELDGKERFGADGCEKGESRPFTWKDMFR